MSIISDKWLHNIAAEVLRLPPLNPVVAGMLISVVELHIKKIIQEAHKFQRHGKSKLLSGKLIYGRRSYRCVTLVAFDARERVVPSVGVTVSNHC